MSSTRRIAATLQFTSIAVINLGIAKYGVEQGRRNQEIVRNLPEPQRTICENDPLNNLGNSGDTLAVINARMLR